jgi:uncharacterized protein YndB with AHSA1/START domain
METTEVKVELEHVYAHKIDRVWRAISDEQEISAWFIKADFKAIVGYHYTFTHETTTITGEVVTAAEPNELAYTWNIGGMDAESTVTWKLESVTEGTRLVLTHTGIESYGDSAAQMFGAFKKGWETCMSDLGSFLDGGNDSV